VATHTDEHPELAAIIERETGIVMEVIHAKSLA